MGASSVTGVGQGSADKTGQKGSEHLFLGVEKLIGTRIVLSGITKLTGGTTNVYVGVAYNQTANSGLPGQWSIVGSGGSEFVEAQNSPSTTVPPVIPDYIVMVQVFNNASAHACYVSAMSVDGSGNQYFTITGTTNDQVFWQVIRHSFAAVVNYPTPN